MCTVSSYSILFVTFSNEVPQSLSIIQWRWIVGMKLHTFSTLQLRRVICRLLAVVLYILHPVGRRVEVVSRSKSVLGAIEKCYWRCTVYAVWCHIDWQSKTIQTLAMESESPSWSVVSCLPVHLVSCGPGSIVGIVPAYGLDSPGIESR